MPLLEFRVTQHVVDVQYVIVHLLRLRLRPFAAELIQIAVWTAILIWVIRIHPSQ